MRRLLYFFRESLANIRINRTTTLIAIGTTGFTLACLGVFLLLYLNLRGMMGSLQEDIEVVLYLRDEVAAEDVSGLKQRLEDDPQVASVSFVSKAEALREFRDQFPSEEYLLEGLGPNPLPASFIVSMAPQFRSPDAVKRWSERQRSHPGVETVQYSREWIENLESIMAYFEFAALSIGVLLAAAAVAIIASTIRLTLYARQEEIEIMRMIGATGTFIKVPYLLEGAVLGALGGVLSLGILRAGFEVFTSQLGTRGHFLGVNAGFAFFPLHMSVMLVVAGFLLGSAGSFLSLVQMEKVRA